MIKKWLVLLLMPIYLCGCNEKTSPDNIELTYSCWGTATEIQILKNQIKEYEKATPNIRIKLIHIPENYYKKIHLLLASKTEPDIILINNQNIEQYGKYLKTLEDTKYKNTYFKTAIEGLSYKGNLKALPRDMSMLVIYVNKTLLTKYGINIPDDNWTIDDFLTISKALKEHNKYSILLEDDLYYLYPFLLSIDGKVIDQEINELKNYKSIELYKDMSCKYHYSPEAYEIGKSTGAEFFINEKSAFYLSGRWMTPKITELAKFDWDIIKFPTGKNGSIVPIDATGWGISQNTKYYKESLDFIEYLANDQNIEEMSTLGIIIPAKKRIAKKIFMKPTTKNIKIFYQISEEGKVIKYPKNYNKIRDKINTELKNQNKRESDRS